jgi:hypothetical protein
MKGSGPSPKSRVPPAERAQETGLAERSLGRAADAFDTHGIISLFRPTKAQRGWSISTIARYLDVSHPTIYEILK